MSLPRTGIAMVLLMLLANAQAAGYYTFEQGRSLYDHGAYGDAAEIFASLAEEGDARAQYYLGELALQGHAGRPDPATACDWFERAADNNHLRAFHALGNCYLNGKGREQNIDQAIYLYGMAAERGQPEAQYQLARMYATGSGVPKNPERAYIYLFLALRGDLKQAPALRDSLEAELNDEQLQRAQKFALKLLDKQSRSANR